MVRCDNLDELVLGDKLGNGWQKEAWVGHFRGRKVVVKVIIPGGQRVQLCLESGHPLTYCHYYSSLISLYEILINEQLDHPGIIKPLGYCIRDVENPPEEQEPPLKRGVITVYEFGDKLYPKSVTNFTEKMLFTYQFADLLDYFEHSPIGSLFISDLHSGNVVQIDGQLKASDIEESWVTERRCGSGVDTKPCLFGLKCKHGECLGFNAKIMMNKTTNSFLKTWLRGNNGSEFENELSEISTALSKDILTAAQLRTKMKDIVDRM